MAVTRLERKARRNKTRAKERTKLLKRLVNRIYVKSPYKEESGVVLEGDVTKVAANLTTVVAAPKKEAKAPKVEAVAEESPKAAKPKAALKAKAAPKGDKLTKIEGVGPKIASVLAEAGLDSFAAVAASTPEAIREILDAAEGNFAAHDPGTWTKQAEMAAAGQWDELKAWQDELDGGK
ncbi:MAG: putative flap endonuclease-1-like 5' DNA nuclease [Bacteroidia bacterium]|jgi:predicted flap endonuclease-1-like 5' DNA nuclease